MSQADESVLTALDGGHTKIRRCVISQWYNHRIRETTFPCTKGGSGWTIRAVIALVAERFNVSYSQRGMRKILGALGFSSQRGRPFSNRRSREDQRRFDNETREVLEEVAVSGQRMIPLAGAQRRVYLAGTVGKRWSRRGQQPRGPSGSRRKYAENIYGALHPGRGDEVAPSR